MERTIWDGLIDGWRELFNIDPYWFARDTLLPICVAIGIITLCTLMMLLIVRLKRK